jgi:protein SCO1/2
LIVGAGAVLIGSGCGGQPDAADSGRAAAPIAQATSSNLQTFMVKGVVRELRPADRTVVIQHEDIPGYMKAMTMPFEVRDTNELAGLAAGDQVEFRMLVTEKEGWIDRLIRVGREAAPPPQTGPRQVRFVEPLNLGDPVPDCDLTNQFGQRIRLSDYRGSVLGMTFIFTRCPFPNFCPQLSANFSETAQALARPDSGMTNWHLLSVSFDPEFDTPEVLHRYAVGQRYDSNRWTFATGAMKEIDALTEQFGLLFGRDGETISHNARTVVIDPAGRLSLVITGNVWAVQELVEGMRAAQAEGSNPRAGAPARGE